MFRMPVHASIRSTTLHAFSCYLALVAGFACGDDTAFGEGCQSDAECKGDRVCMHGECIDPNGETTGGDGGGDAAGDGSEDGDAEGSDTAIGPACGDGEIQAGEACDDANVTRYDGCDADCQPTRPGVLATGYDHTCAVVGDGLVRCWGFGAGGQLGYGSTADIGDDELPKSMDPVDLGEPVIQLGAGFAHTCALVQGGDVYCWGYNWLGVLGYGNEDNVGDDEEPASVGPVSLGGEAVQIAVGQDHTCVLLVGGTVRCWGQNFGGELGLGHENHIGDDELPSSVSTVSLGGEAVQLAAGNDHTCAVMTGGVVRCWGRGVQGQLGYGDGDGQAIGDNELPNSRDPIDLGRKVVQVSAGQWSTCARTAEGDVYCWGWGETGALGHGDVEDLGDDEAPGSAGPVSIGGSAIHISSGMYHHCAVLDGGDVRCWGDNQIGQLGYGNTNAIGDDELPSTVSPVNLDGLAFEVQAGNLHTCALLTGGTLRCWGNGSYGKLGYGNHDNIGYKAGQMPPPAVQFQ